MPSTASAHACGVNTLIPLPGPQPSAYSSLSHVTPSDLLRLLMWEDMGPPGPLQQCVTLYNTQSIIQKLPLQQCIALYISFDHSTIINLTITLDLLSPIPTHMHDFTDLLLDIMTGKTAAES